MRRSRYRALGAALVTVVAFCGCSWTSTPSAPKVYKVGLVTDLAGLNDNGVNHLAYVGLQKAIAQFHIKGDVLESKSADDYASNLEQFAHQDYDLVIAVNSAPDSPMQPAVGVVAQEYQRRPAGGIILGETGSNFAVVDGAGTDANFTDLKLPNVKSLYFKEQEAGAIAGVVAGLLEKDGRAPGRKGVIGAVGSMNTPSVNRYLAGYKWAATMEDPSIKVVIGYSNDYHDPGKCASAAQSQIVQGAGIIFAAAGPCGTGALQAAGQSKVYSIGSGFDQKTANSSVIASVLNKVDVATYAVIKAVVTGTAQNIQGLSTPVVVLGGGAMTFDVANGGVGYAIDGLQGGLPSDIKSELDAVTAQLAAGTLTPPDTLS